MSLELGLGLTGERRIRLGSASRSGRCRSARGAVGCGRSRPFSPMSLRLRFSGRRTNAIVLPSGDHAGSVSEYALPGGVR
jgi:hypothetical protein